MGSWTVPRMVAVVEPCPNAVVLASNSVHAAVPSHTVARREVCRTRCRVEQHHRSCVIPQTDCKQRRGWYEHTTFNDAKRRLCNALVNRLGYVERYIPRGGARRADPARTVTSPAGQSVLQGSRYRLGPIGGPQLAEDAAHVKLDRAFGDVERARASHGCAGRPPGAAAPRSRDDSCDRVTRSARRAATSAGMWRWPRAALRIARISSSRCTDFTSMPWRPPAARRKSPRRRCTSR